jgi:uncharacterized protein (DUF924 family)
MTVPLASSPPAWANEVLQFWFGELTPTEWFTKSDDVDRRIRDRFVGLYDNMVRVPPGVGLSPERVLAAILVFDQLPRNMFRDTPGAFATDHLALELAKGALRNGMDLHLTSDQRLFVYLPFEHAESREEQSRAVSYISKLHNERYTQYAEAHRAVIARFGRFPHRNAILGRMSTAEEIAFLGEPGSSF